MSRRLPLLAAVLLAALTAQAAASGNEATYRHVLDGSPIEVPTTDPELSAAVKGFHETGENPYVGDAETVADGKEIYQAQQCGACHMPDGSGRIGPSFLDDQWNYDYTATMRGRFAIVYAGGAGAMQAFGDRLSQDQILKVLAYIEKLRGAAK